MKLTTFLLFAACMQISAKGLSQQISISERNVPLKKVLKEVARQAGISLVYDENLLSRLKPVTIELKNATVQEAMSTLLKGQPVAYTIEGKRIVIQQPAPDNRAAADTSITVSGRITNDAGEGIPGATVRVAGTSAGTASDLNGHYSIRVPNANASLIFSFLGYNSRTLKISGGNMDVKLQLSETELTETVVVGYGVQKKSVVTGAISSVRAKDLGGHADHTPRTGAARPAHPA